MHQYFRRQLALHNHVDRGTPHTWHPGHHWKSRRTGRATTLQGLPNKTMKKGTSNLILYPDLIQFSIRFLGEHCVIEHLQDHLSAQWGILHNPRQLLLSMKRTTLPKHHHQIIRILDPATKRNGRITKKLNLRSSAPRTNPHRITIHTKNLSLRKPLHQQIRCRLGFNENDILGEAT